MTNEEHADLTPAYIEGQGKLCPVCGSANLGDDTHSLFSGCYAISVNGLDLTESVECLECNTKFEIHYTLSHVTERGKQQ